MQQNQIKAGAILSYVQMALSIAVGLIYTPVMIRLLGQSEYGLYSAVTSVISMLYVLHFGFGSAYQRYYSKYKKCPKGKESLDNTQLIPVVIIANIKR